MIYVKPTSDIFIKYLFGKEEHKSLLLDFELFRETGRYHLGFMLRECRDPELYLTDHLVLHFLELPGLGNYNKEKQLEQWLYYLKNEGKTEGDEAMKILLKENPQISKAHEKYEAFTRDEALLDAYEAHMKWKRDYYSGIESARLEGEKIGVGKGEVIGKIRLFHEILGLSVPLSDELKEMSVEELKAMLEKVEYKWMHVKSKK
ncbi:hypothetical protein MTBBW1_300068 [Desulfamplus magnetovallimortis]|uniref:PD-(D/E)XK nuclease family transposase n=1 Tax=Desulfamplus magnetovallimortis TaxID=1246637 RepID=A0A1W1HFT4_9BACT|nr:PD-(D/E)XK nuclease family transposase [Desulfamplus magnetovallimortis]SLM31337.1 hypothetical protein MTBBW1_300068 [Desulfamplus magnetovallimortis]